MSQLGQIIALDTDPAANYLDAIATNAMVLENLQLDLSICGTATARSRITGMAIVSVEALDWELWLFRKAAGVGAGIATNSFIGYWSFLGATAKQIAATGLYYYYIFGLDVPYTDDDPSSVRDATNFAGRFHLGLVNRSAAAKTAGAGGAIKITLFVDPTHG